MLFLKKHILGFIKNVKIYLRIKLLRVFFTNKYCVESDYPIKFSFSMDYQSNYKIILQKFIDSLIF